MRRALTGGGAVERSERVTVPKETIDLGVVKSRSYRPKQ